MASANPDPDTLSVSKDVVVGDDDNNDSKTEIITETTTTTPKTSATAGKTDTAASTSSSHSSPTVQPKNPHTSSSKIEGHDEDSEKHLSISEKIKAKAYIPSSLPKEFLRVLLNERQLNENRDEIMAQHLQYGAPHLHQAQQQQQQQHRPQQIRGVPPGTVRGQLQLDIVEAKLAKNYGLLGTRMDPYVRIRMGSKVYETHTDQNGSRTPKWRKTITCLLQRNIDTMLIEVFDEKSFTEDDLIAFVKYPLPNSLLDGIFLDEWIPLSGKTGEMKEGHINIQMIFTPLEAMINVNRTVNDNHPYQQQQQQIGSLQPVQQQVSPTESSLSSTNSTSLANRQLNQQRQQQSSLDSASSSASSSNEPPASSTISSTNQYTDDDLKAIHEMFPSFDVDVIKSIMASNNGNKEACIESLLDMS